jgi:hypothetical protein
MVNIFISTYNMSFIISSFDIYGETSTKNVVPKSKASIFLLKLWSLKHNEKTANYLTKLSSLRLFAEGSFNDSSWTSGAKFFP